MKKGKNGIALLSLLLLFAFCVGCANSAVEKEEKTTEAKDSATSENSHGLIELSDAQMKAVGIAIGNIELKNLKAVVKASGQLAVPPQNRADVNVLLGGIVRKIAVLEGQYIRKGQAVGWLENQDFVKLQQDYLSTKNSFSYIQAEYTRQKELNAANAGTGKSLQQAEANYNAEKSKIAALEHQLQQVGIDPQVVSQGKIVTTIPISAPISGTVGHIAINTGSYVEPGKRLMEIIDNSQIHCDLIVFEKDLFKVKTGQKVSFTLTNQNNQEITGRIYGINKSFEDESKGIIVHAVIDNANRTLIPGMYVTALIDIGNEQTLAVPVDALVRSEAKDYIFVLVGTEETSKEDSTSHYQFKAVEVVTGISELGYTAITPVDKIPNDARIVTKGAFYVLSKSKGGEAEELYIIY